MAGCRGKGRCALGWTGRRGRGKQDCEEEESAFQLDNSIVSVRTTVRTSFRRKCTPGRSGIKMQSLQEERTTEILGQNPPRMTTGTVDSAAERSRRMTVSNPTITDPAGSVIMGHPAWMNTRGAWGDLYWSLALLVAGRAAALCVWTSKINGHMRRLHRNCNRTTGCAGLGSAGPDRLGCGWRWRAKSRSAVKHDSLSAEGQ